MIWLEGAGEVQPAFRSQIQRKTRPLAGRRAGPEAAYDQLNLSGKPTGETQFHRELVSRLVQEVRTVHTTGDIQRLVQEVGSGAYAPDPAGIAARMLLEGELD